MNEERTDNSSLTSRVLEKVDLGKLANRYASKIPIEAHSDGNGKAIEQISYIGHMYAFTGPSLLKYSEDIVAASLDAYHQQMLDGIMKMEKHEWEKE